MCDIAGGGDGLTIKPNMRHPSFHSSYSDIGALAKKSNDNALSLVFKIANE